MRDFMNEQELQKLVESISLKYFNKAFKHQAIFNTRLKTTGGRYHLKTIIWILIRKFINYLAKKFSLEL